MPILSLEPRPVAAQPVLFVRRQVPRAELATAIGEGLGKAFGFAQTAGAAVAGPPFTRYVEMGDGLLTIEAGMPVAAAVPGAGDMLVALHAGHYDQLGETYAAMERWMAANGRRPAGAPWESYLTDPGSHPDAAAWRTEVYWPVSV
jgi:AraC family transcriptional regulator